jgi:hypothetical protein
MKTSVLIQRELVSEEMIQQLLENQKRGHQLLLDRMDEYLAQREADAAQRGKAAGAYPPANRELFQAMYDAVLAAFHSSNGDASTALRVGAAFGQAAMAQVRAAHPEVHRWAPSAESFWKNFFNSPTLKQSPAQRKAAQARSQLGQRVPWVNSPYQNFMDEWREFLADLDMQGAFRLDAQA